MIIIADSGSTSTSWRIIDDEGNIKQESTAGLNPYYSSREEISQEIKSSFLSAFTETPVQLTLYGSGCESLEMRALLKEIFNNILNHASIEIQGDMLGAARATCGKDEGIVGILGTGSNSCHYNGTEITRNVDSLGFVMGDEGSGNHMGKKLLADYLRKSIPDDLAKEIDRRFALSRDDILKKVYKEERPSRFLAQFAKFIFQYRKSEYMSKLITNSFHSFFEEHVERYVDHKVLPCHLVGSIAFYFSDYVRMVAKEHDVRVQNILENPIAGLTLYHSEIQ